MIEEKVIDQIASLLNSHGLDETAVTELKHKWPDVHFTYCSDDDVCGPKAIRESENFSIYLVDNSHHCISFTTSAEAATGLVLAEHEEDF